MTWQFSDGTNPTFNLQPSTYDEAVWRLKQMLKSMTGSFVAGSGDGLSQYQLGDHPYGTQHYDVLTGYGSGANGIANNNAWFALKMPSGRFLMFQRGSASWTWRIVYSPLTVGGSVQTLQAGSSTAMALPAFDVNWVKGSPSTYGFWFYSSGGLCRLNMGYDDATFSFYMACWVAGSASLSQVGGSLLFEKLAANSYPSEDVEPYLIYCPDYGTIAWKVSSLQSSPVTYLRRGLSGEIFAGVSACSYMGPYGLAFPGGASSNPYNGKDDGLPVVYAKVGSWPCGYKGIGSVYRWTSATRGTGQALNQYGIRDRIVIGDCNLPWNGELPLV